MDHVRFGGGVEMMRDKGDLNGYWHMIDMGISMFAPFQQVPWARHFLKLIPLPQGLDALWKMGEERLKVREKEGSSVKDVSYHMMLADEESAEPRPWKIVANDAGLVIIGGADTTSTIMAILFYLLIKHPNSYNRLREEVDQYFPGDEEPMDTTKQAEMPFLNAVINETLRLYPPAPLGSARTPAPGTGGGAVGDKFIPEGIQITVHIYSIHHDPRYFSPAPDSFIPERWIQNDPYWTAEKNSKEERRHVVEAFIPFSQGPANCIGKNLALLEMRLVVSYIMKNFELDFHEGWKGRDTWLGELTDYSLLMKTEFPVTVKMRQLQSGGK